MIHILVIVGWFVSGALFSNAIPHLVQGVSGNKFPTPFAKPPGKGLSSALINVLWGFFNLLLVAIILSFIKHSHSLMNEIVFAVGALLMGIGSAVNFAKKEKE